MVNADRRVVKRVAGAAIARPGTVRFRAQEGNRMASMKQRQAARRNIKKAAAAATRTQTLKHLPKRTRQALGKEAAKARRRAA